MRARLHAGSVPEIPVVDARTDRHVDAPVFPHHADLIPPGTIDVGAYQLRFAWTRVDLHAVQSLRFRVFNEELNEGLQTAVMAATRFGFYSATLFELGAIPGNVLDGAVEIGRACVDPAHRSGRVLRLLWKGLARYVQWNSKRYLFGCCSLAGTSPSIASEAWRALHARNAFHDRVLVKPRPQVSALADDGRYRPLIDAASLTAALPPLFDGYLALGAKVCGAPATDHDFGTTDFLVLLDVHELDQRTYQSLFG